MHHTAKHHAHTTRSLCLFFPLLVLSCARAGWFSSCVPDAEDTRDGVKLVIKV